MKDYTIPSLIIGAAIIISSVFVAGALEKPYEIRVAGEGYAYRLNTKTGEVVFLRGPNAILTRVDEDEEAIEGILPAKIDPAGTPK